MTKRERDPPAAVLVNIDVDDLPRAIAFYCAALDLTPRRRIGEFAVELGGGPLPIHLLPKAAGSVIAPSSLERRDYTRHWTPVHLDFAVRRLESAVARAQDAGARLEGEIGSFQWGRIASFVDPFGHGFCLIEFTGRGYDEVAHALEPDSAASR